MKFELTRHENPDLLRELEDHRLTCPECQKASSLRNACDQARELHDKIVKDAQAKKQPWSQVLDISELPTGHLGVEFLEETKNTNLSGIAVATLQGVDVSIWQGQFPWNEAASAGIQIGIAKSSEGDGYTDSQWGWNVGQLLIPGPIVGGSYHFARPDLGNSPQAEADWYISRHPAACFNPELPWIFSLDAESNGGSSSWVYGFMDAVSARIGYSCWFYSYSSWIQTRGVQAFNRPLWLAWPNVSPPPTLGWPVITMQQYGLRSFSVGQVDADEFFGDRATLYTLGGVGGPAPQPPIPLPPPPLFQETKGAKVLAFHDPNRWDYVFIRGGHLVRRWGDSISGMADGLQQDGVSSWGELDEGTPGVNLIPGTEWATWDPSGMWSVMGAQGTDGQQYFFYGQIADGNMSGWQKIKDTVADLPKAGPPGPPGPATLEPHVHKLTTTTTEVTVTDPGTPVSK